MYHEKELLAFIIVNLFHTTTNNISTISNISEWNEYIQIKSSILCICMINKHWLKGITKWKQYNGNTNNIIQLKGVAIIQNQ